MKDLKTFKSAPIEKVFEYMVKEKLPRITLSMAILIEWVDVISRIKDKVVKLEAEIGEKNARIKELEAEVEYQKNSATNFCKQSQAKNEIIDQLKGELLDNAVDKLLLSASELSPVNQDSFAMSVALTCKTWGVEPVLKNLKSRNDNGLIRWVYEQVETLKELGIKQENKE